MRVSDSPLEFAIYGKCFTYLYQHLIRAVVNKPQPNFLLTFMVTMNALTSCLIALRVAIALCTRTFFQPDEFFQSLEPAHHFVFGYGVLTWEWTISRPIRSFFYPALNVPAYWLLRFTNLSETGRLGDWLLVGECHDILKEYAYNDQHSDCIT